MNRAKPGMMPEEIIKGLEELLAERIGRFEPRLGLGAHGSSPLRRISVVRGASCGRVGLGLKVNGRWIVALNVSAG